MSDAVLRIDAIEAGYGRAALVLRGLSVTVHAGTVVCLVGPNGAGKSTVLKVASGMLAPRAGRVYLRGEDVTGLAPERLLAKGLSHVLQGHSVFPEMTVGENIRMGAFTLRDQDLMAERTAMVLDLFPLIGERWQGLAGALSGGEQKMVEIGRALMLDPDVVLMDEPSMGLAPKAAAAVFAQIDRLRNRGTAVLLVEQNARKALELADVGCVLDLGTIRLQGPGRQLLDDPELARLYLGAPLAARTAGSGGGDG